MCFEKRANRQTDGKTNGLKSVEVACYNVVEMKKTLCGGLFLSGSEIFEAKWLCA